MSSNLIASSELYAVIGMGLTGFSVARYLRRENKKFIMLDTRTQPSRLQAFLDEFPDQPYELGPLSIDTLRCVSRIVLSPGLAANDAALIQAEERGIAIVGDIQLFAEHLAHNDFHAKTVAITGSNAKSTVTTLVGYMAESAGVSVAVGGNLSPPALDLLTDKKDLYVLELSSFQLEATTNFGADVAVVLNVTADHMDRYPSIQAYHAAKQRVFQKAKSVVVNREDPLTQPLLHQGMNSVSFGLTKPDLNEYGILVDGDQEYLARGNEKLLWAADIKLVGRHNIVNSLAALAIGEKIGLQIPAMIESVKHFKGLKHRCEFVAHHDGVDYINDSKGTNVGATVAALKGLSRLPEKIVLIAGGDGKGADFNELQLHFEAQLRGLIVLGKDANKLAEVSSKAGVVCQSAESMYEAVQLATMVAKKGDVVLLSPACASLDMFSNYEDRGDQFVAAVETLAAEVDQ